MDIHEEMDCIMEIGSNGSLMTDILQKVALLRSVPTCNGIPTQFKNYKKGMTGDLNPQPSD